MKHIIDRMTEKNPNFGILMKESEELLHKYNTMNSPNWENYAKELTQLQEKYNKTLNNIVRG